MLDNKMRGYFEAVEHDFQALGLECPVQGTGSVLTSGKLFGMGDMHDLLAYTYSLAPDLLRDRRGEDEAASLPAVSTDVGRKALELINHSSTPIAFAGDAAEFVCCPSAEYRLLVGIAQSGVASLTWRSPLVIVDEGMPVAILKADGEQTCYGLVNNLEAGLVEGCFGQSDSAELRGKEIGSLLPRSEHAWSMSLEEAGTFTPIRFSAFVLSAEERIKEPGHDLHGSTEQAFELSHSEIMRQASALLEDAVPLHKDQLD